MSHALVSGSIPSPALVPSRPTPLRYTTPGKRRIDERPTGGQIACLPWLQAELAVVRPQALVCLGATAARVLLGAELQIGRDRGRPLGSDLAELVTLPRIPPRSCARATTPAGGRLNAFVDDLGAVAEWLRAAARR